MRLADERAPNANGRCAPEEASPAAPEPIAEPPSSPCTHASARSRRWRWLQGSGLMLALVGAAMTGHFGAFAFDHLPGVHGAELALGVGLVFGVIAIAVGWHWTRLARIAEHALTVAGDGYLLLDRAGRIRAANTAYCRMTGCDTPRALIGRPVAQLSAIAPSAATRAQLVRARTQGCARYDDEYRTACGGVPVRVTMAWLAAEHHFVLFVHDMTAQRSAERARQLLSTVVDAVGEALILLDAQSRIAMFNLGAQRIFGLSAQEALGQSIDVLLAAAEGAMLIEQVRTAAPPEGEQRQEPRTQLLDGRHKDGRSFPMRATFGLVPGTRGPWVAIAIQDISDNIEAEAARQRNQILEAQAQARRHFLSRMSHELRTPLNAVLGFAQLLRGQGDAMTAKQLRAVGRIESAGEHLLGMVNDLMDLSQLDQGGMRLDLHAFDVADEWPQAIALVLPMARARNINIRSPRYDGAQTLLWAEADDNLSSGSARVLADPMRVRQILVNLLSNAIKYNRDDGAVSLEVGTVDAQVHISVSDTGFGLSPEQLQRIGEPFNRLGAEQRGIEGTGLGLALSRNLAQAMHGELRIDSVLGFGTRVSLVLPLADPADASDQIHQTTADPRATTQTSVPLCVLHVEDDPVNVELVSALFAHSRPNIDYVPASSGVQALAWLREHVPDIILTDMNLGDMRGQDLLDAIRSDARHAAIPVLALSGDAMLDSVANARRAGFFDYLTKPVHFEHLLSAIDAAARARGL